MRDWLPFVPALLFTVVLLWVPGFLLQLALRDRRPLFLLASPVYSMAVIGTAGVVLQLVGLPFSWETIALFTAVVAVLAAGTGWLLTRHRSPLRPDVTGTAAETGLGNPGPRLRSARAWLPALAVLLGAVLLARRLLFVIQEPERFSQRYDNVFHLNAIRYAVETASASSLTLGRMTSPEAEIAIYPAVWHGLAALVHPLADNSPMVASNIVLLGVGALVWPAACVYSSRITVGGSPVALILAGVASAGFALFPFSLMEFGPLFPNLLGLSVAPVVLAHTAILLGLDADSRAAARPRRMGDTVFDALTCLLVTAGAVLAHPNILTLLLALSIPMVLTAWFRALRPAAAERATLHVVVLVLALGVAAVLWSWAWSALGTDFVRFPHTTPAGASGEAMLFATNRRVDIPWVLAALTVVGVVAAIRGRGLRWLAGSHAIALFLYVVAASAPVDDWREWVVGSWYQDSFRLAASLPVTAVPLISLGASATVEALRRRASEALPTQRRTAQNQRLVTIGVIALAVLVSLPLTQRGTMRDTLLAAQARYGWTAEDGVLTLEELDLLKRLPDLTDPEDTILVNPWNGGALAYAVSGSLVTQYHLGGPGRELAAIIEGLAGADAEQACALSRSRSIDYVLDFGQQYLEIDTPKADPYHPIDQLGPMAEPNLELVASEGAAELWAVTAC